MNQKELVTLLCDVIEASEEEKTAMLNRLEAFGTANFSQWLDEYPAWSTDSYERLNALRTILDSLPEHRSADTGGWESNE